MKSYFFNGIVISKKDENNVTIKIFSNEDFYLNQYNLSRFLLPGSKFTVVNDKLYKNNFFNSFNDAINFNSNKKQIFHGKFIFNPNFKFCFEYKIKQLHNKIVFNFDNYKARIFMGKNKIIISGDKELCYVIQSYFEKNIFIKLFHEYSILIDNGTAFKPTSIIDLPYPLTLIKKKND